MMLYGSNAKIVFNLIFEFYTLKDNYSAEDFKDYAYSKGMTGYFREQKYNYPDIEALSYLYTLRSIVEHYILIPDFSEEVVFNRICDDYNRKLTAEEARNNEGLFPEQYCREGYWIGMEDFIDYRKALTMEKELFGFKNMLKIYFMVNVKKG